MQLALTWHDRLNFVLGDDFILRSIRLADDDLADIKDDLETPYQKFDADLVMMTEMFSGLLHDLLQVFSKAHISKVPLALAG
jgi:DNA recombination-dependent growth factor C